MTYKTLTKAEKWILLGIPVLFIIGSAMHFLYGITGNSTFIGIFAPVNESVWEHCKLALWPLILWWTLFYFIKGGKYAVNKNKWFGAALFSLITYLFTVPLLFYFYTEAVGVELLWADILIFLLSLLFGQTLALHYYRKGRGINYMCVILIFAVIVILFAVFTFFTPHLPIFMDPITGTYGI